MNAGMGARDEKLPPTERSPAGAPSSPSSSLAIGGALVDGRYEILGILGAGGMGRVYKARDMELDELVALKVLRRELVDETGMLDRFRREVKLARRVTHKNVARTFDIGAHEGLSYLTMELIEGESLAALVAREGKQPRARVMEIAVAVCAGLGAAHAAGVVHRDLKPDNVLLEKGGRVVVTDFGIARAFDATASGTRTIGATVGTPAYMAPEQVEGLEDVDARADVYALGAMLFELLTGERAWGGDAPLGVAAARLMSPPPDPRKKTPDIPDALATLVMTCMARRREDRFPTADLVMYALNALATTPARAPTSVPSLPERVPDAAPIMIDNADDVAVGIFRNALLVHFKKATPLRCVASIRNAYAAIDTRPVGGSEKVVFFASIELASDPPDEEVRRAFTRFFEDARARLACAIIVAKGEGFRGAMVRAIISGIMSLSPSFRLGFPRHVVASVEEGAALATRSVPTLDASSLLQAFQTFTSTSRRS